MPKKPIKVKIKAISEEYKPTFAYSQNESNCLDLRAYIPEKEWGKPEQTIEVFPGHIVTIRTGVSLELPDGYEAVVRPRSGLAKEHGISLVNSPGTIDTGYRGEILLIVTNLRINNLSWSGYPEKNLKSFVIKDKDRIAQLAIREVPKIEMEFVEELSSSVRESKGIGSTGVK